MSNKKKFKPFIVSFSLILALAALGVLLIGLLPGVHAQEPGKAPDAAQASVGTGFTYQGFLKDAGGPVNGTCSFQFSLYDAPTGANQIGATQNEGSVAVTNGYFSVTLNGGNEFGATAFQGDARYLEITVNCGGGNATLSPRVSLSAAPYALSLRPGAVISGSSTSNILRVQNTDSTRGSYGGYFEGYGGVYGKGTGGFGPGVRGESKEEAGGYFTSTNDVGVFGRSENSWGMYGYAAASSGTIYGAYGRSDSTTGRGVYGYAHADSGTNYGVYGETNSPDGYGVYAKNTSAGGASDEPTAIRGEVNATDGFAIMGVNNSGRGVYGEGHGRYGVGGFSFDSYGVFGRGYNDSGIGVMGEGTYTGTVGIATAITGTTSGVYGKSVSPYGAGGRFIDMSTSNPRNSAGVWIGSYWSDIIRGYELNSDGSVSDLKFRVNYGGEVYADGSYNTPAADFAELLPGAEGLEPGDVLIVDSNGQLARSVNAYASAVVGVYSTKPGFVGGASADTNLTNSIPLAVVGVVPVKASAENGAIVPGDLLVTSATPGYAMKADANPTVGTVIGKALDTLDSGTGIIQILVILQ